MRTRIFSWLGREFIEFSGEARSGSTVEEETRDLLHRFAEELRALDLSLEHTVRTRLWTRDREIRTRASKARSMVLDGNASASSSSYISPDHFESNAKVALDLCAMRPAGPIAERKSVPFEPPRAYLRYLCFDSLVFVSGFTASDGVLDKQVPQVLAHIGETLDAAGTEWSKVVKLSAYLHRSQSPEKLKTLLEKTNKMLVPQFEIGFVDGFAGEQSLLEIEATATA